MRPDDDDDDDMLVVTGFDDCIMGVVERAGQPPIVCYNRGLIIDQIMEDGGGDREEAEEHFSFNILGAWMGDLTPCFLDETESVFPEDNGPP